jgi:hypothetical protein
LDVVWCEFLRRQELPSGEPLTVPDLLHIIRIHCTAFRILDLPLELRETIYGMAFENIEELHDSDCAYTNGPHTVNPSQITVAVSCDSFSCLDPRWGPRRFGNPTLLHVSRQVRSEAGKLYYRAKQFHMLTDVLAIENPEREVNTWLQTMVGEFATHLRDLTVHITYDTEFVGIACAQIRARYRPGHGLRITGSVKRSDEGDAYSGLKLYPLPVAGMSAYVAGLENIRAKYQEQGEIIVDFFSHWDELRQACCGPNDDMMYMTHDWLGRRRR